MYLINKPLIMKAVVIAKSSCETCLYNRQQFKINLQRNVLFQNTTREPRVTANTVYSLEILY